jgi:uncharacterized repeat protein (TIGR02543 family)
MLTVVSNPPEGGGYEVYPKKDKYPENDSVTLTAVPSAGYVFDNWSGQTQGMTGADQNPVIFLMGDRTDNNRVITANFVPSDLRHSVMAVLEPSGGGSVRFQPDQPSGGYPVNQRISVFTVADTGYVFSRWTGDLAGTENPRTILVSEDKSFTAIFNPTVTTYCSSSEGGSVALEPAQSINGYAAGTEVTVSARAAKGYRFVSWEGDASGSDRSITVTVDAAKTITARFAEQSASRWWLWALLGFVGLFGALVLLRLAYARVNRGMLDETQQPDD